MFEKKMSKLRRSVSVNFSEDSRIFHSTPQTLRARLNLRPKRTSSIKSVLTEEALKRFKSKLSIDSDWSVVGSDYSETESSGIPEIRRSNISLHSLRERSLSRIQNSKIGSKLRKAKKSLKAKFKKDTTSPSLPPLPPVPYQGDFKCQTIFNHILLHDNQEYVEEYDLVIWEEKYEEKSKFSKKMKSFF